MSGVALMVLAFLPSSMPSFSAGASVSAPSSDYLDISELASPQTVPSEPRISMTQVTQDKSTSSRAKSAPVNRNGLRGPLQRRYKTKNRKLKSSRRKKGVKAASPVPASLQTHTANLTNSLDSTTKKPRIYRMKEVYKGGFSRAHAELCPARGARTLVVILVTSSLEHRAERAGVRAAWGQFAARPDVALAFVLGEPTDELKASLQAEDAEHGDLIMGRNDDLYPTLPLKTLSILEWVDTYCPSARFLFKTDDDVFINVPNLLQFINDPERLNAKKTIYGRIWHDVTPKRDPKRKHYLPWSEYPHRKLQDFTAGPAYLVTRDAVRPLRDAAWEQPYLRLEDVFVTGIVANAAGVRRQNAYPFDADKDFISDSCTRIAIHEVRGGEQLAYWQEFYGDAARWHGAPPPAPCASDVLYPAEVENELAIPEINHSKEIMARWQKSLYH